MRGRPAWRIAGAAVVAVLIASALKATAPVRAAVTYTGFVLDSEPGAKGNGQSYDFDPSSMVGSGTEQNVVVSGSGWGFQFLTNDGSALVAGTFQSSNDIFMVVNAPSSQTCFAVSTFEIIEAPVFADGDLVTFSADFKYRCNASTAWLRGSVRFNSAYPTELLRVPSALTLANTIVGQTSPNGDLVVTNMGGSPVSIGTGGLIGTNPGDFEIETNGCFGSILAAGSSCTMTLSFSPTATTTRSATLSFIMSAFGGSRTASVSGYGVSPLTLLPVRLSMWSDPGDWVGKGQRYSYDPASMTFQDGDATFVRLESDGWNLGIYDDEALQPGTYVLPGASQLPILVVYGHGAGCNFTTGSFDILEAPVFEPDGSLSQVAYDFVMHCDGATPALRGSVRFHSSSPIPDVDPPVGSIRINEGNPYTNGTAVNLDVAATDTQSAVTTVAISNDGATWTNRAYAPTQAWSIPDGLGAHTVYAKWKDVAGNWTAVQTASITIEVTPPVGTVEINADSPYTTSTHVAVDAPATDALSGVVEIALSNDGVTWTIEGCCGVVPWPITLPSPNGVHTVYVKWRDGAGNWSAVESDSIVLDTVAATVTTPKSAFVPSGVVVSGATPTKYAWFGADSTSGVVRYEAALSTDGGTWSTLSTTLTSATLTRSLVSGHSYRFRARAVDTAGNVGAWVSGPTVTLAALQEMSSRITYSGTWYRPSSPSYWGSYEKYAKAAGAKASFTFTGRTFAWVGCVGPTRGSARIYVNGVLNRTVSTYATTTACRKVLTTLTWPSALTRKISIVVVGTAGHSRVDLDALVTGT